MANRVWPGLLSTRTLAAVRGGDGVHDGQAQAGAGGPGGSAGAGGVAADEPLEQGGLQLRRDAGAVVGDGQLDGAGRLAGGQGDRDRGVLRGVLGRVAHQVGQHLVQPVLVAADQDRLAGQFQQPAVTGGGDPGVAGGVDGQPGQVHRLAGQRAARVQLGEQQQLVDQHAHPLGFRLHPAQRVLDVGAVGGRGGAARARRSRGWRPAGCAVRGWRRRRSGAAGPRWRRGGPGLTRRGRASG